MVESSFTNLVVVGSSPVAVTETSDFTAASSKKFLDIQTTIEYRFTLKRVPDMTRTYIQIHRTDKYSQQSSINLPVWLNGWIFVFELSGCWFESSCGHSDYFGYCFIKNDIVYVFTLYLQNPHYFNLFKIDTLKFAMYILMNFTCPLKTYVVRS